MPPDEAVPLKLSEKQEANFQRFLTIMKFKHKMNRMIYLYRKKLEVEARKMYQPRLAMIEESE